MTIGNKINVYHAFYEGTYCIYSYSEKFERKAMFYRVSQKTPLKEKLNTSLRGVFLGHMIKHQQIFVLDLTT